MADNLVVSVSVGFGLMSQSKLKEQAKVWGFVALVVVGVTWLFIVALNSGNSAESCAGDDPAFWCELGY